MASVKYAAVGKTYPDGTQAVRELNLDIEDGQFTVLVGPSGCGKTTALRMCAGLEEITSGELLIGDAVINRLDPQSRDVAMVFQNYALYPHMSVFENIAFPLRSRRVSGAEVKQRVNNVIDLLDLGDHAKRKPKSLSGGQRQRVAMGRAIVRQPKVFLMDEPLSNLDAKLRVQMRAEIARLQSELGVTTVYVTHDQVEAMTMGDQMAVMRKGVLQQAGPPQELYKRPANLFVAQFIGSPAMTLFGGSIESGAAGGLVARIGQAGIALSDAALAAKPLLRKRVGNPVTIGIRPEHLQHPESSDPALPRLNGRVTLVEPLGPQQLVHIDIEAKPVVTAEVIEIASDTDALAAEELRHGTDALVHAVATFDAETQVATGEAIEVAIPSEHMHFFDLDTGRALG